MTAIGLSRLYTGRVHYAWIVLAVMFSATLAGVGVRAAPGVMILPLQRAFGWDVSTISGAVSVNIILLGVTAPFLTGLIEVIGLKRMVLLCMGLLIAGTGLSTFMTTPWQLFVTWGFMVGIGSGRRCVRYCRGGGEPLVREAQRLGNGPVNGSERGGATSVPTAAGDA